MLDEAQAAAWNFYDDALPYHNWKHVQNTVDAAEDLLARCREHDVDVDGDVVRYALYFHDVNYRWGFQHHDDIGYDSLEAYSAAIAETELSTLGIDPGTIEQVQDCILATQRDATYDTPEQKVVRAADLHGLMTDYGTFRQNSLALREEHELLGEPFAHEEWVDTVADTLQHYLSQDIQLTPEHDTENGLSRFHANAGRNLGLFLQEFSPR